MKLLIIFDKNIKISPEKVCIHVGHSCRFMGNPVANKFFKEWSINNYKTVLLQGKLTDKLVSRIQLEKFYEIRDAGLDGVFEPDTLLGYAVLVEDDCTDFNKIQTLKFKD